MKRRSDDKDDPGGSVTPGVGGCAVDVLDASGQLSPSELSWLVSAARQAVAVALGSCAAGEVRVLVIGDAAMAQAHQKYSGVAGTTDVLTFDLADGATARGEPLDVDIMVCVDEARRQAGAHGHSPERELLLYILHGVLHCLGHDDHDPAAFDRMHAEEDRILTSIGVGATFVPGTEGA